MQIAQHGFFGSTYPWRDTNEEGQQVVWAIGDSHTVKRNPTGSAYGPTPAAGTVFQWDVADQDIYEIGATDILQSGAGANWGSIYPQMGISYFNATGRKPVFVTGGVGGTNYAPRTGDSGDWSAADTIYSTAKTQLDNCLAYLGLSGPKYIYVNLGINDARGATAIGTIETEITAFYDKLHTDYPRAIIIITMIGRQEVGELTTQKVLNIRDLLKTEVVNRDYMHICASETAMWSNGYYDSDLLHLLQTGNNIIGEMVGRWMSNYAYTKWARSIISCHFDELSTARKALIQTWVNSMGAAYFAQDFIYVHKTTIEANTFFDWTFHWAGFKTSSGFTANSYITTNGTSSFFRTAYNYSIAHHATQDDGYIGTKILTNRSAAGGSTRVAMGHAAAGDQMVIGQTNLSLVYHRYNDLTLTTEPDETKLGDDAFYCTGRSGTTKILYKNGVNVNQATAASTSRSSGSVYVGCLNNAEVAGNFLDADFEYSMGGLLTGNSLLDIYNAMEALIDGW